MAHKKLTKQQWQQVEYDIRYNYGKRTILKTISKKQAILYKLVTLRSNATKNKISSSEGLCHYLASSMIVSQLCLFWDNYSGNPVYPIPVTDNFFYARAQFYGKPHWEGKQLELRIDLSKFLLLNFHEFFKLLEKIVEE